MNTGLPNMVPTLDLCGMNQAQVAQNRLQEC